LPFTSHGVTTISLLSGVDVSGEDVFYHQYKVEKELFVDICFAADVFI
jgi:hypothetical protein